MTHLFSRRPLSLFMLGAVMVGAMIGIGLDRIVLARQDGVKRTILLRTDDPAGPRYEAVMGIAEIAPGASTGRHTHSGVELAYLLEGSVVVDHDGQPSVTLKPGEALKNVGAHDARNIGKAPARILAVYLVEKGKPLADPVVVKK